MIQEIKFYNDRISTHGHREKDPAYRYITIHELGILAEKLCSAKEIDGIVRMKVKEFLLRKALTFNEFAKFV